MGKENRVQQTVVQGTESLWTLVVGSKHVGWVEESVCTGCRGGRQICQDLLQAESA